MIYLNNSTEQQTVFVPRNDGLGSVHTVKSYEEGYADGIEHQKELLSTSAFTHNGEYEKNNGWSAITVNVPQSGSVLENKEIVVSQDVTIVVPTSGYDGFSAVTVDATEYAQQNYEAGYDDGLIEGLASGETVGEQSIIDTFTSTTLTINGQYGSSASPYSSVTVNVQQTGHTDQELENAYNSGHTEGMEDQKELLSSTSLTENGSYTNENGWSGITVNIDTASTFNSGYTSGYTDGVDSVDTASTYQSGYTNGHEDAFDEVESGAQTLSVTANGTYNTNLRADGYLWDEVVVNVPQTGGSSTLGAKTGTTNGTYNALNDNLDGYSAFTINVDTASTYQSGYTDGQDNIIGTFSAFTATTNGVYGSSAHPFSSITVGVPQTGDDILEKLLDRSITNIYIPSGTTEIGYGAFDHCKSLSSVTIPNTVEIISNYAFSYCESLSSVTIPNSVELIGPYAFDHCKSLSSVTIPNTVTYIGDLAFRNCESLQSITFSNNITNIKYGVCLECSSLTSVILPTECTKIEQNAFGYCGSLSSITIQSAVTTIEVNAFRNCSGLTEISVYAPTAPTLVESVGINPFTGIPHSGTLHHPQGSDYSSWQSISSFSDWTFIDDIVI